MTTWWTSDTHFGHANIVEFCRRPFYDVHEMDAELVKRWNARVKPGDEVYHLGDFAFGTAENIPRMLGQLNGRVHLIRGNHDRSVKRMLSFGFASVSEARGLVLGRHTIRMAHKPSTTATSGVVNLCGHVHNNWRDRVEANGARIINVGVDVNDFEPKTLEELLR